jgi:hypothetical protein
MLCVFRLRDKHRNLHRRMGPMGRSCGVGRKWMGRRWTQRMVYAHCYGQPVGLDHNDSHCDHN